MTAMSAGKSLTEHPANVSVAVKGVGMRHWYIILCIALLASNPAYGRSPKIGEIAPDFELTLVDGGKIKLSELRGQVVVLNFWATWCGPCKRELPLLDVYYKLNQKHGLKVFAITTEDSVPLSSLKKLFAVLSIPSARHIKGNYPILEGVPTNYVFDRAGRLRYAKAAAFDLDALNNVLVPLLSEPVPVQTPAVQTAF